MILFVLGIQILQGLNVIYTGNSPYVPVITSLDLAFCSGNLIVAYQFENGLVKVFNVGVGQIVTKTIPLGHISLACSEDSLLMVVASRHLQHSWAARICLECTDPPYYQGLAPYQVLAVHQL